MCSAAFVLAEGAVLLCSGSGASVPCLGMECCVPVAEALETVQSHCCDDVLN